jgi:cytochrome c oxidase subunit I+III
MTEHRNSRETQRPEPGEEGRQWLDPPGFYGWLTTVDHKRIGRRYIVTAFLFFACAGLMALTMRLQLARPNGHLVGPDFYNQLFSTHGSIMMFLFAVPVMQAMGVYLVPLQVGARNIAFSRLNAFSYWMFAFGGIMILTVFALNTGPEAGWFSYVPLAGPQYSAGKRQDFWAQMITFTEAASLIVAIELIVTAFKLRAPGMTLNRVPLFVWAQVVTSFMVLFAMPSVMLASSFLMSDRLVSTQFFNPAEGGDALLWQHLFWFFGHPEVYIIFVPALGIISAIIGTFARRPPFGYLALVLSLVVTAFLAFGLWVHHMFATGLPPLGMSFFTAASILIAIPTGVQIFCWIATLATGGRLEIRTPLLFVIGFFFIFIIGGLTGVMLASASLDSQLHDNYFVVAHLHYVLIGGAVFPLFGGVYYWFPKMTGRMLSELAGKWNFWLFFIGFNMTFFPMHILGLDGMTRRIYTYDAASGWGNLNLLATVGAIIIGLSVIVFFANVLVSLRSGARAAPDPWGGKTLEWATQSPPEPCNFPRIPVVESRYPLAEPDLAYVTGLPTQFRAMLVTRLHDAAPDHVTADPYPTIWPLLSALATTVFFIGTVFTPWGLVWGPVPVAIALTCWFWPKAKEVEIQRRVEIKPQAARPAPGLRAGATP